MSHVSLVPAQLARLLDAAGDAAPPPNLRAVLLGGGTIPAALVTRALDAGWPVVPTYGLSEAGSGVTALPTAEAREAPGSAGRPLPGRDRPIEEPGRDGVGEIVVTRPRGSSGYLGEPPARRPDPDRRPRPARRRGAAVRRRPAHGPDRARRREHRPGGGRGRPARATVDRGRRRRRAPRRGARPGAGRRDRPAPGCADPGDDAILLACRASLAGFKVPAAIVRLDALPRTSGGKLRRDAVRALVDDGPAGILARPDGDAIGWRVTGDGGTPVVLLPGTLSTAGQLDRLAAELARPGRLDRPRHRPPGQRDVGARRTRGRSTSRAGRDLVAYLDARGIDAPSSSASASARWSRSRPRPDTRIASRPSSPGSRPTARSRDAERAPVREAAGPTARGGLRQAARPPRPRRSCAPSPATRLGPAARPRAAPSSPARGRRARRRRPRRPRPRRARPHRGPDDHPQRRRSEPFYAAVADALAGRIPRGPTPHARGPRPPRPDHRPPVRQSVREALGRPRPRSTRAATADRP